MSTPSGHTIILLLSVSLLSDVTRAAPVVQCPWGSIQGVDIDGEGGRRLSGYLGVPYARPPVGDLRWQKPLPHPGPGDGHVFVADTLTPACPQKLSGLGGSHGISEDCLILNVFVPVGAEAFTSPVPVMVFIHGGGFTFGEAAFYKPTRLVSDGGVIVVTIQYRLGTLGFLSTGDDLALGNFGLWDQTLAIRWVKDNIRAFSGDPEAITIFGESAGGMSVGFHTLSPESRGLFRRAVLQSGTPNVVSGLKIDEKKSLQDLSRELNCEADTSGAILQCLRACSADDIVNVTEVLSAQSPSMVLFLPRVDGDWLPRDVTELLQDEQFTRESGIGDLDIVVGFNNNEGALVMMSLTLTDTPLEALDDPAMFRAMLDASVRLRNSGQANDLWSQVVEFFYRGADSGLNTTVPLETITQMYGDALFSAPSVEWLRSLASQPHAGRRYLYLFDHDFSQNRHGPAPGSHHGDELFTEFEIVIKDIDLFDKLNKTGLTAEEEPLSELFVDALTSFAKTGKPSPALQKKLGGDWPEFTTEDEAYLSVSLTPSVQRDVFRDRVALWAQLLPQLTSSATTQKEGEQTSASQAKEEL